jgi:hypothetical protein
VKMKKHFCAFLCLCPLVIMAQDSLHICRNQIFVEGLGNSFADPNSSADGGIGSLNYERKVIFDNISLLFSLGVGPLHAVGYDYAKNTTTQITIINFPVGILGRGKYNRNGLWYGVFFTPCFGRIVYLDRHDYEQIHNFSFQVSPNLTYQFQSKSEHFFVRLSLTPKILASAFTSTDKYGYGVKLFPFWGGISIGGGW